MSQQEAKTPPLGTNVGLLVERALQVVQNPASKKGGMSLKAFTAKHLAARAERLKAQQSGTLVTTDEPIDEGTLFAFEEAGMREEHLTQVLTGLTKEAENPPAGFPVSLINATIAETQAALREVKAELQGANKLLPSIVPQALARARVRDEATKLGKTIKALDLPGKWDPVLETIAKMVKGNVTIETTEATVRSSVTKTGDEAKDAAAIAEALNACFEISENRIRKFYGPTTQEPTTVACNMAMARYLGDRNNATRAKKADESAEVAHYLIGMDRSGEKSELDTLKEGSTRIIPFLRDGQGTHCVFPAVIDNRGREDFLGEVLLERNGSTIVCRKVTHSTAAHRFFGQWRDRAWKEFREKGQEFPVPKLISEEGKEPRFDLEGVRNFFLRQAIERQIEKDWAHQTQSAVRRNLREVGEVENRITLAELRSGEIGTCVLYFVWQNHTIGDVPPQQRERVAAQLTLQVSDDRKSFLISEARPEGVLDRVVVARFDKKQNRKVLVPAFKEYETPKPLHQLDSDRSWQVVRDLVAGWEGEWMFKREMAKHNATLLAAENIDGLTTVNGADGLYGVESTYRSNRGGQVRTTDTYYLIEREASAVRIVWAAKGTSEHTVAEQIGTWFEVSDLPKATTRSSLKAIMRNMYRYFHALSGLEGLKQVPAHLVDAGAIEELERRMAENGKSPDEDGDVDVETSGNKDGTALPVVSEEEMTGTGK